MKHWQGHNAHLFVLERGEKLVAALTQGLKEQGIQGATISGLGALCDVELGYYELERKTYLRTTLTEDHELISLTGNVSVKDGQPFVHVHATLGDARFQVFGGHLFEATVAVTAEVSVLPLGLSPERKPDESIGLALICSVQ